MSTTRTTRSSTMMENDIILNEDSDSDYTQPLYSDDEMLDEVGTPEDVLEIKRISQHLKDNNPTTLSIVRSKISFEDKARLLEKYEIFKHTEPTTSGWLQLKDEIKEELNRSIYEYKYYNSNVKKEIKNSL